MHNTISHRLVAAWLELSTAFPVHKIQIWEAYQEVNRCFAQSLVPELSDGDAVWIQDYHLFLLPSFLRDALKESKKEVRIGFFLHTVCPDSDFLSILPEAIQFGGYWSPAASIFTSSFLPFSFLPEELSLAPFLTGTQTSGDVKRQAIKPSQEGNGLGRDDTEQRAPSLLR